MRRVVACCAPIGLALIISAAACLCALAVRAQSAPEAPCDRVLELYRQGKYAEAVPIAERYVEMLKSRRSTMAPQYATAIDTLAALYRAQGRYAEAEPLYKQALAIDERALGRD